MGMPAVLSRTSLAVGLLAMGPSLLAAKGKKTVFSISNQILERNYSDRTKPSTWHVRFDQPRAKELVTFTYDGKPITITHATAPKDMKSYAIPAGQSILFTFDRLAADSPSGSGAIEFTLYDSMHGETAGAVYKVSDKGVITFLRVDDVVVVDGRQEARKRDAPDPIVKGLKVNNTGTGIATVAITQQFLFLPGGKADQ